MNEPGQQGSPSTSSSSSSSSVSNMPMPNNIVNNNGMGRRGPPDPSITMSQHNVPPAYNYNPRGINTVGVELQLSNIDREIRGLQQQQEQMELLNAGRSLTPDGILNNSPRSLFTPAQLHQFKDQVRRYRMLLMWNQGTTTTPPPSTPSPTVTPPMVVPPLEPRLPARGRGSRGPRGSRGQPRTRTNRPRAPKAASTAAAPPPQLPPPYVRYPTPYVRYPPRNARPQYNSLPPTPSPFVQGDILEGLPEPVNQEQDDGLIRSIGSSHCSFCASYVAEGTGISLQSCLHTFCRPCLIACIEQSESAQIPCPVQHESRCGGVLRDPEIKVLVSPEVYQAYISRSLTLAIKSDNSLSKCFVPGCSGVCVVEDGLKSFYCPVCSKLNCLHCETTHDAPCEASKKRTGITDDESFSYDIAMKRSRAETAGEAELRKDFETNWEQMCAKFSSESDNCNTNTSDPATGGQNSLDSSNSNSSYIHNSTIINHLEKSDLITTIEEFECSICLTDVAKDEGVMLQECLHRFCRECLASTIEHCEQAEVKCPYKSTNYSCPLNILDREIKALVSKEVFDRHLSRSVMSAEMTMPNAFHCKSVNCSAWCEVDAGVPCFLCPICQKTNCIPCKAIHEAISCADYQKRLRQGECDSASQETLNKLIDTGKAMRCPTCKVVIIKNGGCDGFSCQICHTAICWATKGPRWGPKGQGDTSGGCHCGEKGQKCHPNCGFCH